MSYVQLISEMKAALDPVTLGSTVIMPRQAVEALACDAYNHGLNVAKYGRPTPTVMTFEGKRIDPDKLAVLLFSAQAWYRLHGAKVALGGPGVSTQASALAENIRTLFAD